MEVFDWPRAGNNQTLTISRPVWGYNPPVRLARQVRGRPLAPRPVHPQARCHLARQRLVQASNPQRQALRQRRALAGQGLIWGQTRRAAFKLPPQPLWSP